MSIEYKHPRNIILSRPDHIGDFLLALPLAAQAKCLWPCRLTVIGSAKTASLKPALPWVDEIWDGSQVNETKLRAGAFDTGFFPKENDIFIPMAYRACIPKRIGRWYKPDDLLHLNKGYWRSHRKYFFRFQTYQNLDLLRTLDKHSILETKFEFAAERLAKADSVFEFEKAFSNPQWTLFILDAVTARPLGERSWIVLATALLQRYPNMLIGLCATPRSEPRAQAIKQGLAAELQNRILIDPGKTSIAELARWVKDSRLVVGPSTGPMHLAAACGTPQVCVYVSQDICPTRWQPWSLASLAIKDVPHCHMRCHPWECTAAPTTCDVHLDSKKLVDACMRMLDGFKHANSENFKQHLMQQALSILCTEAAHTEVLTQAGYHAFTIKDRRWKNLTAQLLASKCNVLVTQNHLEALALQPANIYNSNFTGIRAPIYVSKASLDIELFEAWIIKNLGLQEP